MLITKPILYFFTFLLIIQISLCQVCQKDSTIPIDLSNYKIAKSNNYRYSYTIHESQAQLKRNDNGTFFTGNFSTLVLKNMQNKQFIYQGIEFNFQCPALHKPTKNQQLIVELQITYKFKQQYQEQGSMMKNLQNSKQKLSGPYEYVLFSFPFMVSQFVPQNSKPINQFINSTFQSGTSLNLSNVLRNLVSISTLVYTAKHPLFIEKNILRLVTKQLRLMSKSEFKEIKKLLEPAGQLKEEKMVGRPKKIPRPDRIYQIKSYPFSENNMFKKEDL